MTIDIYLFEAINQFAGKWVYLDTLAIFFAKYFEYIFLLFLFVFLAKNFKKHWLIVAQSFLAGIFSRLIIVEFIRWICPRTRPFIENQVNLLLEPFTFLSFPSGHASFYFALASVIFFYNKKAGALFIIGAFLISFSRIFTGLHWPLDILSGALVGFLSGFLVILFFQKLSLVVKK